MRIGVDIDGVLVPGWGVVIHKIYKYFKPIKYFKFLMFLPPMHGAIQAIKELNKKHELVIVTSRRPHMQRMTLKWLDKYFPGQFKQIYFTTTNLHGPRDKKQKAEKCVKAHIPLLIDDSLSYAKHCAEKGINVLLYTQPWNQKPGEQLPKKITRVKNWKGILKEIK
ncbi:MAG: hypothetical protein GOV15_00605 [Candidatus Diapherotrites archaeon]|nr:hypothetical protein [Candidatus Diapherotrites archaeon]